MTRIALCLLLSGCTTLNVAQGFKDTPATTVNERGLTYTVKIDFERSQALVTRDGSMLIDGAFQYGQRKLAFPEVNTDLNGYRKQNAKRALKKALPDNCKIAKNGDGSTVFFSLNAIATVFAGDIDCS